MCATSVSISREEGMAKGRPHAGLLKSESGQDADVSGYRCDRNMYWMLLKLATLVGIWRSGARDACISVMGAWICLLFLVGQDGGSQTIGHRQEAWGPCLKHGFQEPSRLSWSAVDPKMLILKWIYRRSPCRGVLRCPLRWTVGNSCWENAR